MALQHKQSANSYVWVSSVCPVRQHTPSTVSSRDFLCVSECVCINVSYRGSCEPPHVSVQVCMCVDFHRLSEEFNSSLHHCQSSTTLLPFPLSLSYHFPFYVSLSPAFFPNITLSLPSQVHYMFFSWRLKWYCIPPQEVLMDLITVVFTMANT